MEKIILAFLATAAFCGTTVSAMCDNTTSAKIEECVLKSDLFKPANLPGTDAAVAGYCSANATVNCLATQLGDCSANDRETKLINNLLTKTAIVEGQATMCFNDTALSGQSSCYTKFTEEATQTCLTNAVGALTNVGDTTDLKTNLNSMCTFFAAYIKCFENLDCSVFVDAMNGIKYRYCSMSATDKAAFISEYETGSATILSVSLISIITAIVAAFIL